jgi:PTS system fructose-specific IIC component
MMIYTCTLNPSVDYVVQVQEFQLGDLNRMSFDAKFPGGKGINVSRVLKRAGVESKALGFIGGLTGWLKGLGTTNLLLLGLFLGGMMSIDMGGPINKAALTFGIAMINAGDFAPHAAIMAGGMVAPLGIALATTLFRNKFTAQERGAGKTSYIMGLSFITEGAIPFAAADPARVIPACVIGSAIAGALTNHVI